MRILKVCMMAICVSLAAFAAPLFTQCPAVGVNTGCQFLITFNSNGTVTVAEDPNPPNNGPYDAIEDTLVGVQNNSSTTVTSIPLSSTVSANGGIFSFDGDGPCTQSPAPASCPGPQGFDPTGYGGPGVSFSNIAANSMSGTVNFSPGIAPGGSAWFGLEDVIASASDLNPGTPNAGGAVPEPASWGLALSGALTLLLVRRRRSSPRQL